MPELPEVETVMRGMDPVLTGKTIRAAQCFRKNLRIDLPADFSERLEGRKIVALRRRSKYILMDIEDGPIVLWHLGMSGRVSLYKEGRDEIPARGKHDHVTMATTDGGYLVYTDPRRFGIITFIDRDDIDSHKLLVNIGPEPLGNAFGADTLMQAFAGKTSPIKTALLDQRIVAGLGNIYVCEVLWRTGIHPARAAGRLSKARIQSLVPAIRTVLSEAIEAGGSTLKDYAQVDGELGYFQHRFKVYGREGENCATEKCTATIKRITQAGRSTFYCPKCQR